MTDQLTPLDKEGRETAPAFAPPTRIDRAKSEIMAGGAVSEHADDEVAGGWQGFLAMAGIAALFVWLATVNIWIFVFVVGVVISIFLHELGHLQLVDPRAKTNRRQFGDERVAEEFSVTWRRWLWSQPFDHADPAHHPPGAMEFRAPRGILCPDPRQAAGAVTRQ